MADSRGSHNNHDKNSNDSNRGSHNNHDKNSNDSNRGSHNNHDKNSNDSVATLGNQNINCMGSFMNCRNEITNIICSQVTYCIIGQVSPFLMVNPTSP
jgi:hypothetical protein